MLVVLITGQLDCSACIPLDGRKVMDKEGAVVIRWLNRHRGAESPSRAIRARRRRFLS